MFSSWILPDFNPPTPCGVGRHTGGGAGSGIYFNPPTPCGVGHLSGICCRLRTDFNPPTPCGVGRQRGHPGRRLGGISIHPPRVGWDPTIPTEFTEIEQFQSTHPVWGGTARSASARSHRRNFNPPTPCGVGRRHHRLGRWQRANFNPPTPCGVGPGMMPGELLQARFQSTHPVWGGTGCLPAAPCRL